MSRVAQGLRRHLPVLAAGAQVRGALAAARGEAGVALVDGHDRRVNYLRVSLTERCNYRCTYCMPAEGVAVAPRAAHLSVDELCQVVAALMPLGVRRVRLTGGEPTVRGELLALVERLAALGLDDLSLSTNGERLAELAAPLRRAGLLRLNVSLDSLDPQRFQRLTRHGQLPRVLAGLEAAQAAGFVNTKINTVVMRGFDEDEVSALCRFAWERALTPRFIELMPMAEGALFYPGTFVPVAELRGLLAAAFGAPLPARAAPPGAGPARYLVYRHHGQEHHAGFIAAVTEPFCEACNRVRLAATGQLHLCLGRDESVDLRAVLRGGAAAERVALALRAEVSAALRGKAAGHSFQQNGCGGPRQSMVSIGG